MPYGTVPKVLVRLAVAGRQRRRPRGPDLDGRPDGRPAPRGHEDPQREQDRAGRRRHGRRGRRAGRGESHDRRRRGPVRVHARDGRPRGRRRPEPGAAGLRARAAQGEPVAPPLDREEPVRPDGGRGLPRRDVPRSVLRPALPRRRGALGLHAREREGVLVRALRRRPRDPLRGRASSTPGRQRPRSAGRSKAGARPRPPRPRRRSPPRSARSRFSTGPGLRSPPCGSGCP